MSVDTSAPEVTDVRTARRFSMQAPRGFFLEATSFDLDLPSASESISMSISSASMIRTLRSYSGSYFGQCSFTDGVAGFVRQVDGNGSCTIVGHNEEAFHSAPGSNENVIVRCRPEATGICSSMMLDHRIDPVQLGVTTFMREPNPAKWMPIAKDLREFLDQHVSYLPDC
ncbi:hypothetical protein [Actibacterium sp. 188UL27-1]|uniref:hypothetical protein n=1 Tax=Actibacterium sp. 188UL27-1 TaxID=2786961 RepID=UPI00195A4BB6|nr:hypothetical protein [Actibacterium sp. 188UL27-1]MBM7067961.1 hypothetical protein [Actibacterium sp. 188UL27-1]